MTITEEQRTVAEEILPGGGEMGSAVRAFDWSKTPLGSIESWSISLRTAVSICLNSRFPMVIWWGKQLTLLYNDAWQPMLGSKHPQALGQPGQEVWAEIGDIIGSQLNSVLSTGLATGFDDLLLLVERHGYTEEAYFTYSYSPIFLENGQVGGAFTAVTETTQRVLGERRLASLRSLAALAGIAKNFTQVYDGAIKILARNPADIPFALLYQIDADRTQAVCKASTYDTETPASLAYVDLRPQVDLGLSFAAVIRSGQALLIEDLSDRFGALPLGLGALPPQQALVLPIRAAGQDISVVILIVGINPCRQLDDDYRNFLNMVAGHIAAALGGIHAEEERKRAEALAREQVSSSTPMLPSARTLLVEDNADMCDYVKRCAHVEKILEMTQAAREEAEAANRIKDEFLAVLSHELRSPLNPILGWAQMLRSGNFDEQTTNRALETIERNAKLQAQLIEDLLDISRILHGKMRLNVSPINLVTIIEAALETVHVAALAKSIHIQTVLDPNVGLVSGDTNRLQQVVWNLLANALKFTPPQGRVEVRLERVGAMAKILVKDTGVGINSEFLAHVFEYFRQENSTTTRKFNGLGLGLALVRYITELHGGSVTAESPGEDLGATFTVWLPLLKTEDKREVEHQEASSLAHLNIDTSDFGSGSVNREPNCIIF